MYNSMCGATNRHKKKEWLSHDNQSSVNLKSNTMKNTMQRYGFFAIVQYFRDGISDFFVVLLIYINSEYQAYSKTVAYAEIPSSLPVKPSFSVVVALMLTASTSICMQLARHSCISGM